MPPDLSSETVRNFAGRLITPRDADYDAARRVWNGLIDRRPALIAKCASTQDIVLAIRHALDHNLQVAVRSGGHSIPGHSVCDGGLVIDLGSMNSAIVDPVRRRARVQGGCLLRDLDKATQAYGLGVPAGVISHTGVAGLTLGGGLGHLMRKHGLTIDSLVSAEVVGASGDILSASAKEHPDLFWATRGGGGNFGIVTQFEFDLHAVTNVFLGVAIHRLERARPVLERWRETMSVAPDELLWSSLLRKAPALPWIPPDLVNTPVLLSSIEWCAATLQGERFVADTLASLNADASFQNWISYLQLQSSWDPLVPHGSLAYCKAGFIADLGDSAIDALLTHGERVVSDQSQLEVMPLGGAIDSMDASSTAYPHRNARWIFNAVGICRAHTDVEANKAWVRDTYDGLQPFMTGGSYVNFMGGEETGGSSAAYGATLKRLRAIKAKYDPGNFFRLNQNIAPETG